MNDDAYDAALTEYRDFCKSYLADWQNLLPLRDFLEKIPQESIERLQGDEPRTIRIAFLAPTEEEAVKQMYSRKEVASYLIEHFGEVLAQPERTKRIEQVFREEIEQAFSKNPPGYHSASIQVGNITVIAETLPREGDQNLHKAKAAVDEAYSEGYLPKDSFGRPSNNVVRINDKTCMAFPNRSFPNTFSGEYFLHRYFHQLATLADSFQKSQEQHNQTLSNLMAYSDKDVIFTNPAGNIFFSDTLLEEAKDNTTAIIEGLINHEFAHHVHGDMKKDSPQYKAIHQLQRLCVADYLNQKARPDDGEGLSRILIEKHGSAQNALEAVKELDALLESISPIVAEATSHMEGFPQFETFFADEAAVDRQRKNRFVNHVLAIPGEESDEHEQAFQRLQDMVNELDDVLMPKDEDMDAETVSKVREALNDLLKKHSGLMDDSLTLRFCKRHIGQANEILADFHAVEVSETPETVSEVFKAFEAMKDINWGDYVTSITPPSQHDSEAHPSEYRRIRATQSYAASVMAERSSGPRER